MKEALAVRGGREVIRGLRKLKEEKKKETALKRTKKSCEGSSASEPGPKNRSERRVIVRARSRGLRKSGMTRKGRDSHEGSKQA